MLTEEQEHGSTGFGDCVTPKESGFETTIGMPQFFPRTANSFARLSLLGGAGAVIALMGWGYVIAESSYETGQGVPREQPIPFSHDHHAGGLGLDCRYCHTTVETSSFADIPATKICMNCHSQMWAVAPIL